MNEAIKLAIENGWDENRAKVSKLDLRDGYEGMGTSMFSTDKAMLDPLFWQTLGKALGYSGDYGVGSASLNKQVIIEGKPWWQWAAHQYFGLLLTGGDTEQWWKKLLKPNQ